MARACLSVAQLARKAAMPEPTVKNSLYGAASVLAPPGRIAAALGVDVTEIIQEEE